MRHPLLGGGTWEEVVKGAEAFRESLGEHGEELKRMVKEDRKRIKSLRAKTRGIITHPSKTIT